MLEPILFDDGWVRARQSNALLSGGFSNYYDQYGGNLPLLTWFEWLQQFVVAHSSALVVGRLPGVLALVAVWLICRSCLGRLIGDPSGRGNAGWWSAAVTFVVGAAAFGITLRPEPFVALLVIGAFAACQRYLEAPASGR